MQWWHIVLIVLGACFLAPMLIGRRKLGRWQASSWGTLQSKGLVAAPSDQSLASRWPGEPFDEGTRSREVGEVYAGHYRGHDVVVFDFVAGKPGPKGSTLHVPYVVYTLRLPATLPSISVRRVMLPRMRHWLRGLRRSTPQAGDEQFDSDFTVECDDDRFAAALLQPAVRRKLDEWTRTASYRIHGDTLLLWRGGVTDPRWMATFLDVLVDVADAIPEQVWAPYGRTA